MLQRTTLATALLALLCPTTTWADLVVTLVNPTISIAQGGTGTIDVRVHSDDGSDVLGFFSLDLTITGPGGVRFADPHPDPYTIDETVDYVFLGNSDNENNLASLFTVSETLYARDTITGADTEGTFGDVPLGSTTFLLARLNLEVDANAPLGDSVLTLLASSSFTDSAFVDVTWGPLAPLPSATISVAVPEPSSLLLVSLGATVFGTRLIRRRRADLA